MRFREQSKLGLENREALRFPLTKKSTPGPGKKKSCPKMGQENSLLSSVSCSPAELTGIKSKHINYKING